jgi:hypothetical protein
MNSTITIEHFANTTKNICLTSTISIILILLFIVSPLRKILFISIIGKIGIIILLSVCLYIILNTTFKFINENEISFINSEWNELKSNLLCNYVFSFFLFVLLFYVIKNIFI